MIRDMVMNDLAEVLSIERASFEFAWDEDDFVCHSSDAGAAPPLVMQRGGRIVGYIVYLAFPSCIEIMNLAVAPEHRLGGVGRALVRKVISKLYRPRRERIVLEVRETNLAAQLFFRSLGFRAISVLRESYIYTDEDAYLMEYAIPAGDPSRSLASSLRQESD